MKLTDKLAALRNTLLETQNEGYELGRAFRRADADYRASRSRKRFNARAEAEAALKAIQSRANRLHRQIAQTSRQIEQAEKAAAKRAEAHRQPELF